MAAIDLEFAQEKLNSIKTMRNLQEELTEEKLNSRKMMTESRKTMSNLREELFEHRVYRIYQGNAIADNFNTMVSLMRDQIGVQNAQNNSFRENMSQQMELVRQQQNQITNVSIGSTMSKESSVRGSVL